MKLPPAAEECRGHRLASEGFGTGGDLDAGLIAWIARNQNATPSTARFA
jgi:hypothetical protein